MRSHLLTLPKGHKARAFLDSVQTLPEYLKAYIEEYRAISLHRTAGFSSLDPLLHTLEIYDRKMGIEREPFETEILITLDLLERAKWAKASNKDTEQPKAGNNRGNRR